MTLEEVIRQRLAEATEQSKDLKSIRDEVLNKLRDTGKKTFDSNTHINDHVVNMTKKHKLSDDEGDTLHDMVTTGLKEDGYKVNESKIDEEFDSIDTYSLEELEEFMVSEEFEQLDEISGKLLGSYIQKARGDIANKKQHAKDLDANPKVAKLQSKLSDYYNRREYTKSGDSKHRKAIDATHQKIYDTKKVIDPEYPDSISAGKRNNGVGKAVKKLQYGKLTEESLDAMSQEEFDSIDEEQLDELSKATLGSYIKNSARKMSVARTDTMAGAKMKDKRERGISTAVKKLTNESEVSSQVASLLEAEGLSDEFKVQAVTIFEAAVTDRVLQIEEGLKEEFESNLAEAKKELNEDIDGFVSEAIQQWKQDNLVAINSNFKSQMAESFMDGLRALIGEHNIEVPEDKEDALVIAMGEVDKLNEALSEKDTEMSTLIEQVNSMKAEKLLESFREKMTITEFDRFAQLTESIKFKDETQYEKQLNIVLENFGAKTEDKKVVQPIVEEFTEPTEKIVVESNSRVEMYAKHLSKK